MIPPGAILSRNCRNRTGCVGISIVRSASNRRDGTVISYFSVHARKPDGRARNRKFSITRLGRHEAWRRALKFRAEHELKTKNLNTEKTEVSENNKKSPPRSPRPPVEQSSEGAS